MPVMVGPPLRSSACACVRVCIEELWFLLFLSSFFIICHPIDDVVSMTHATMKRAREEQKQEMERDEELNCHIAIVL
jgi:hypothetical protein